MSEPILEVTDVSKRFVSEPDLAERAARLLGAKPRSHTVHAVDKVSLSVRKGEVMGLVGESGCGKTTLGRIAAGLLPPSEGTIRFRGRDLASLRGREAREARLKMQLVFQDPMSSLNPRLRVEDLVGEAPLVHGLVERGKLQHYIEGMLGRVGLDSAAGRRYPHQFSGGQRARIGIARALAVQPDFIVCDESVAALDVSIQAQILNLFIDLREDLDLTYLFISHDLGVVEHISDRIAVMYLGRVVEFGSTEEIFAKPSHPYTAALLAEVPTFARHKRSYSTIKGEIPSPLDPPPGCHFHPRCPHAHALCRTEVPALKEIAPGRFSACHLDSRAGV